MPGIIRKVARQACHEDAAQRLKREHINCKQVIRVDVDAILYLDLDHRAMTAWMVPGGSIIAEAGFMAEPGY